MKTWKKIVLGVSLISLFLGGGLVAWGYSQGGLTDLQNKTISEQDYVKKEVKDFNKIDIKSSSYNVLIKNGDVDKATLSYYQKTKNPIDTSVKDGQLTINDNNSELDSTSNKHINFFGLKDLVRLSTLNEEVRNKTIVISALVVILAIIVIYIGAIYIIDSVTGKEFTSSLMPVITAIISGVLGYLSGEKSSK